ncbi:hypothetical protein [Rosistilla oblonga]|uniref:hypothetical protein n=1 Tax=Rosistilla oblonga TaxID=2527990 RepID=UPI003A984B56
MSDFTFFGKVDNPLSEAIEAIVGEAPPVDLTGCYSLREIEDDAFIDLQNWASDHAKPTWATGLGVLEAAAWIVEQAVDNCNIEGKVQE